MKIIAATSNKGKVREIRSIFSSSDIEIISMSELGINIDIEETGTTFEENAAIKADSIAKLCSFPVLADDSGLCVEALGGAPGIYSARYAGGSATDDEKIDKLLENMKDKTNRKAKFVSAVVLVFPNGEKITAKGEVFGHITNKRSGHGGFGYDPVFYADELGKTFGESDEEEKNKVSHRGRALTALYEIMKERGLI